MESTPTANTSSEHATASARIAPSRIEDIAMCAAVVFEFVFIVVGNLLTIILFTVNTGLRNESLFLVINTWRLLTCMMLATVALPIYVYHAGAVYQFWTGRFSKSLSIFFMVVNPFFSFASMLLSYIIIPQCSYHGLGICSRSCCYLRRIESLYFRQTHHIPLDTMHPISNIHHLWL